MSSFSETGSLGFKITLHREHFMGKCKKDEAFALMDEFYNMGGNFIDTYVTICTYIWWAV